MAPRAVLRHAEWTISLDLTANAPRPQYALACQACEDSGPPGPNREALEMWALNHTARNPSHRLFTSSTWATFLVTPGPSNPLYGEEAER
jgi:hypothetical protein